MYVEDLKRGTNKDIGPKDIFEMGSKSGQGVIALCTAFHNNVQNYAITELRHKRVYGCRKKRLNTGTFF